MAKQYADFAEFYIVYVREAHAADSDWAIPVPGEKAINTPKTFADRLSNANKCCSKLKIDMPCLVDDINDATEKSYSAWPDRLFVVDTDGKIAVRADRGPWGFGPSVKATSKWLSEKFPKANGKKAEEKS